MHISDDDRDDAWPDGRRALDTHRAALYTGIARATLKRWRADGTPNLPYIRAGSKVLYLIEDLDSFLLANRVNSRSRPKHHPGAASPAALESVPITAEYVGDFETNGASDD